MRVLSAIHHPVFGGPHNQALRLREPLEALGWQTTVVLPDEPGNAAERLTSAGLDVEVTRLHRLRADRRISVQMGYLGGLIEEIAALRRLIRNYRADLVQVNGLINPHAAIAARLEAVPIVWQLLDSRAPVGLQWACTPIATGLADVVMTTGLTIARLHPGVTRLGHRWVPYLPPVDTATFTPDPGARRLARERLGIGVDDLVIGTVGNLNPQKGHEYLIRAASIAMNRVPHVTLCILGAYTPTHAAYQDRLERLALEMGLGDGRVRIQDPGGAIADLLPAFDVFALLSVPRSEGIPTVVLEAMSCGIPVVASNVGGVREVIKAPGTGLIVPPLKPDAAADAITALLEDPDRRLRMGNLARNVAVQDFDVAICAATHQRAYSLARGHHLVRRSDRRPRSQSLKQPSSKASLRDLLVCPACHCDLVWEAEHCLCGSCSRKYQVIDGIPVLLLDDELADHDELDHEHHAGHRGQAAYYDRSIVEEFEIMRPRGTPSFHRWTLAEKFRHSVRGLEGTLHESTALTVCGGSGMDAEFLARAGATVIVSDISLGAARRARERARRFDVRIMPVVAAVERLPFRDQAIDVVYVHDGLHHLENPGLGLTEMARVAGRAVSVTEPAKAALTAKAVRLGIALDVEEAGNRVARLTPYEVKALLEASGLTVVGAERYAMYYRHHPGWAATVLSLPGPRPAAAAWRLANALLGAFGNKLSVRAIRQTIETGSSR